MFWVSRDLRTGFGGCGGGIERVEGSNVGEGVRESRRW